MIRCGLDKHFVTIVHDLTIDIFIAMQLNDSKTFYFIFIDVHQGCILTILLFTLDTQPLMDGMKHNFAIGGLKGFKIGEAFLLDYILFANDMGFFLWIFKSSKLCCSNLKLILMLD